MLSILTGDGGIKSDIKEMLSVLENSSDPLEINVARSGLKHDFLEYTWDYGTDYKFFAFLDKKDLYVDLNSVGISEQEMEKSFRSLLQEDSLNGYWAKARWMDVRCSSGNYILKVMYSNGRYLGCYIRADALLKPLEGLNFADTGFAVLVDEKNMPVTDTEEKFQRPLEQYREGNGTVRDYLVIEKSFDRAPFRVLIFVNNLGIYEKYLAIQAALVVLGAAILGTLIFMNLMLYENELNRQEMQMDYLQLQIKPHFYLNCLNYIYQMVDLGYEESAKKMAAVTSDYLRYLFQSSMDFVKISHELAHVRNYLEIQKMRYQNAFTYYLEQDEETVDFGIPPLMIQTFAENAVNHTVTLDRPAEITILVCEEEYQGQRYVNITVSDTGTGFPEEVLDKLDRGGELAQTDDGHRVGITNCLRRMKYFYREKGIARFYNNPLGGAVVELHLPAKADRLEKT
ncbi:MAG: histidine kinase [Eubacteriales bacterium]|nr:histidine kinase [Eubacteriales bacterium]